MPILTEKLPRKKQQRVISQRLEKMTRAQHQRMIGRRLHAARKAANIRMEDAMAAIGQRQMTQLSLLEKGERMVTLDHLMCLAPLYGVSIDYLVGRLDDPSADSSELNGAMIAGTVVNQMSSCLRHFTEVMGQAASAAMMHHRLDRDQVKQFVSLSEEIATAINRLMQMNPSFEEDMRGGSRLLRAIERMVELGDLARIRHDREGEILQILAMEAAESIQKNDQQTLQLV